MTLAVHWQKVKRAVKFNADVHRRLKRVAGGLWALGLFDAGGGGNAASRSSVAPRRA